MRRRQFIAGLGSAAAWPVVARAQQAVRVRRIGVLMGQEENNPTVKSAFTAFTQALADLGWTDGHNLRMDVRWAGGNVDRMPCRAATYVDRILRGAKPADLPVRFRRNTRWP